MAGWTEESWEGPYILCLREKYENNHDHELMPSTKEHLNTSDSLDESVPTENVYQ
jgi:hypothetical protein